MEPRHTERLILRNWREEDRPFFHIINSDDRVMEFFPFRRTREQADQVMDWLSEEIDREGFGFAAIEVKETGELAGFCGISRPRLTPFFEEDTVEIGWRLAAPWWGRGIATEAARHWLRVGFTEFELPEIVSFAVPANRRSTAVMERIGMRRDAARDFPHPRVPASHPHLMEHVVYAITRQEWREAR